MFVALAIVAGGCKYFDKGKNKKKTQQEVVDPAAAEKARQDSIRIAQEQEAERIRVARQAAIEDSIRRIKEQEAQFRFHVITGSFKEMANAERWADRMRNRFGYNDCKIIDGPNGFNLVSVGSYDTYSRAFNQIDSVNERINGGDDEESEEGEDYDEYEKEPWVYEKPY